MNTVLTLKLATLSNEMFDAYLDALFLDNLTPEEAYTKVTGFAP